MKPDIGKWKQSILVQASATILLAGFTFAPASSQTADITAGNKAEVKVRPVP